MSNYRVKPKKKRFEFQWGHCDEILSKSSYWKHRKAYFNPTTNEWTRKSTILEQERQKQEESQHLWVNESSRDIWSCSSLVDGEDLTTATMGENSSSMAHCDSGDEGQMAEGTDKLNNSAEVWNSYIIMETVSMYHGKDIYSRASTWLVKMH